MSYATQQGADAIEFDLQHSSDGVIYLFNDTNLDSLTNGTGVFKDTSSSTISGLSYNNSGGKFPNLPISTLSEVLNYVVESGTYCYPEIKTFRTLSDVNLIVDAFYNAGALHLSSFQSFDLSVVVKILNEYPDAKAGFLTAGNLTAMKSAVDELEVYDGRGLVYCNSSSIINYPAIVKYARDKYVDIAAWTVNSESTARTLKSLGVFKLMSDSNIAGLK